MWSFAESNMAANTTDAREKPLARKPEPAFTALLLGQQIKACRLTSLADLPRHSSSILFSIFERFS